MDPYEYKLRSEEIKNLIKERDYVQAMEIAETIDWKKVRSATTLCTISDLYKINRKYDKAKELLEQAYSRNPNVRQIIYSLCELCIKTDDIIGAQGYYNEFIKLAPTDNGKFILKYKILETVEANLEERIQVLEELKKRDYEPKWGYELAYLYHRIGLATKCVEECDELIVWFREGKYVKKAMELKMLHQQLTASQETIYQNLMAPKVEEKEEVVEQNTVYMTKEIPVADVVDSIQVKTMDVSQYSTINIQKELAESMKDVLVADEKPAPVVKEPVSQKPVVPVAPVASVPPVAPAKPATPVKVAEPVNSVPEKKAVVAERPVQAKPESVSERVERKAEETKAQAKVIQPEKPPVKKPASLEEELMAPMKNTIDIREVIEATRDILPLTGSIDMVGMNEEPEEEELPRFNKLVDIPILGEEDDDDVDDYTVLLPQIDEEELKNITAKKEAYVPLNETYTEEDLGEALIIEESEPAPQANTYIPQREQVVPARPQRNYGMDRVITPEYTPISDSDLSNATKEDLMELINQKVAEALDNALNGDMLIDYTPRYNDVSQATPPVSMQKMLSQGYDGQISFVVPEQEQIEKQITGQMSIDEVLAEWENTKKRSQEKYQEQIKARIMEETGSIYAGYDTRTIEEVLSTVEKKAPVPEPVPCDETKEIKVPEEEVAIDDELPEVEELEEIVVESDDSEELETAEDIINEALLHTGNIEVDSVEEKIEETESEAEGSENEDSAQINEDEDTDEVEELEEIEEVSEDELETEAEGSEVKESEEETESDIESEKVEDAKDEVVADEEPEADSEEAETDDAEEDAPEESEDEDESESEEADESEESESEESENNADSSGESKDITEEELAIFSSFVQTKQAKRDLLRELDKISLASYTGNVFVTGDANDETVELAKAVLKYVQTTDSNFAGKTGKITGSVLNTKDVDTMISKLSNGGLIIEKASGMNAETVKSLLQALNQDNQGVVIIMQDTAKSMRKMMEHFEGMREMFNVHIKIEELSDDTLVAYGRKYAEHLEYSIDEMGMLALHTRIEAMQTSDHIVTVADVRNIVDSAIEKAKKKNLKHFSDILFGKRYDDEDMIILKERDFDN